MKSTNEIYKAIVAGTYRSAWDRGVESYALDLLEDLQDAISGGYTDENSISTSKMLRSALLNGAENWSQYSWGGSSFVYDDQIAKRLCCPSELRKVKGGDRRPNGREEWLDVQARALSQAANLITRLAF